MLVTGLRGHPLQVQVKPCEALTPLLSHRHLLPKCSVGTQGLRRLRLEALAKQCATWLTQGPTRSPALLAVPLGTP